MNSYVGYWILMCCNQLTCGLVFIYFLFYFLSCAIVLTLGSKVVLYLVFIVLKGFSLLARNAMGNDFMK